MGLIVRTAGSNKTKNDIEYDLSSLIDNWNKIKESSYEFNCSIINTSRK